MPKYEIQQKEVRGFGGAEHVTTVVVECDKKDKPEGAKPVKETKEK